MRLSRSVLSIRPAAGTMPIPSLAGNDHGAARSARRIPEFLMPASPPILTWAIRATLVVTLLPLLADCGPARDQFAPPCPRPAILGDTADIYLYRAGSAPGSARDLTDLVLHGRVVGVNGSCKPGDSKKQLVTSFKVGFELSRGPAMQGRVAQVPVFIAVTDGDAILDKQVHLMRVEFPANVDRVVQGTGEADLVLPIAPSKSGAAYGIIVGFQLTPDQLSLNRALSGR
jgi:hypothetical protein